MRCISLAIIAGSLGIGILGYRFTEGMGWLDSLLNASMILWRHGSGGGIETRRGKMVRVVLCAVQRRGVSRHVRRAVRPVVHRFLHKFHAEEESKSK